MRRKSEPTSWSAILIMRKVGVGEQRRSIRNSLVPHNVNSRKFRWYSHLFSLYLAQDLFESRKERAFFSTWLDWIYACVTSAASRNKNFQLRIRLYPSIHPRLEFPHIRHITVSVLHFSFFLVGAIFSRPSLVPCGRVSAGS